MTAVRIGAEAAALRRRLEPVAWFVLEELVLASNPTGGIEKGVRALAGALSLNKDTVARAIVRLRAEGLVVAQRQIHSDAPPKPSTGSTPTRPSSSWPGCYVPEDGSASPGTLGTGRWTGLTASGRSWTR